MNLIEQKEFALKLMDWHGGMSSGVYAVSSCMYSDATQGKVYEPKNHYGHEIAFNSAISELTQLKQRAKYPEAVTLNDVRECNQLATKLKKHFPNPDYATIS